jgi:hypothetical protein
MYDCLPLVFQISDSSSPSRWEPYHLQGDSDLYHSSVLVVRESLQYHPRVVRWISRFWHTYAHHTHAGLMTYREYEALHLRMTRALFAGWDRRAALHMCKVRRNTSHT